MVTRQYNRSRGQGACAVEIRRFSNRIEKKNARWIEGILPVNSVGLGPTALNRLATLCKP